ILNDLLELLVCAVGWKTFVYHIPARDIVPRDPIQCGFLAAGRGLREGPRAKPAAAHSSDRELRPLFELGRLVFGRSARFDGDEFPARGMASPPAHPACSNHWHSTQPCAVGQF